MPEIEIGEYIRSKNGTIGKVTNIEDGKFLYEDKTLLCFINNIVKHSKNIIDLLEVGDYINGEEIRCFRNDNCDYDIGTEYNDDYGVYFGFNKDNIETIVTKEQFTQAEYRIEE